MHIHETNNLSTSSLSEFTGCGDPTKQVIQACTLSHTTGGAIYAGINSLVLIDAVLSLSSNSAEDSGGAVYLRDGAALSAKNGLVLEGNRAGAYGGAENMI
jgi:predicted outer membrane repeat protein